MVTDHQTAGRGRQQRTWHDDPGNAVLMSVLLRPPPSVASLIPLLQGLAVVDALNEVASSATGAAAAPAGVAGPGAPGARSPGARSPMAQANVAEPGLFGLKWPNDVLAPTHGERKLAGILAEAVTTHRPAGLAVVVGTGLNLRWGNQPPAEVVDRAVTLEEVLGVAVERWDVVKAILRHLDRWLTTLYEYGSDPVLDAYQRRCLTVGRDVAFTTTGAGATVVEGRGARIRGDGALVIATPEGEVTVTAGDAHHVSPSGN